MTVWIRWEGAAARARGLSSHLLDDHTLRGLARVEDRRALVGMLGDGAYADVAPRTGDGATFDRAIARYAAARLATVVLWMQPHPEPLAPVFFALDAGSIRGIARGILGGVPPGERTADAIPTPTLGRKELGLLAHAASIGSLGALLRAWEHPLGAAFTQESEARRPDPFRMEASLGRHLGPAMSDAVRRGDRHLRDYASEEVDSWNVEAALVVSESGAEADRGALFVPGGSRLNRPDFLRAASAAGRERCADALATALRGTLFEEPLTAAATVPASLDDRILDARIERLGTEVRRHPVGSAPVLSFVLRLRREGRAMRRALWRTSLAGRA